MSCADGSTLHCSNCPSGRFKCAAGAYAVGDTLINTLGVLVHFGKFSITSCGRSRGLEGVEEGLGGCTYIHTYMHTYIHTSIHTYIHAYMHTYIHVCVFTHPYIYIFVFNLFIFIFIFKYSLCLGPFRMLSMLRFQHALGISKPLVTLRFQHVLGICKGPAEVTVPTCSLRTSRAFLMPRFVVAEWPSRDFHRFECYQLACVLQQRLQDPASL